MRATLLVTLVVAWAVSVSTHAESLPDPTRPPGGVRTTTVGGVAVPQPSGPVLQSTLISPQRKTAVISGKSVQVGDTFQGATIVDITPYEVRMDRGGKETTLRLLPKLAKEIGKVEKGKVE